MAIAAMFPAMRRAWRSSTRACRNFLPRCAPTILRLTADHGNDPTWRGYDHTREHVPILAFGGGVAPGLVGVRSSLADIAETVAHYLELPAGAKGQELVDVTFALDPHLAADTLAVTDLELSSVRLMNDARFPWLILVPRRADLTEIVDLDRAEHGVLYGRDRARERGAARSAQRRKDQRRRARKYRAATARPSRRKKDWRRGVAGSGVGGRGGAAL